jgi:DNA modification methylase
LDKAGKLPYSFATMEPASTHADIWDDITRIRTLNTDQDKRDLEKHICPLQFDVVDRLIERYSNQGELVFDPFAGLFTVPVRAIKLKRRGYGIELNPVSYNDGLFYCRQAEDEALTPDLFALDDYEQEKAE